MIVNFTKLNDKAITPIRGTEYSAGLDLCAICHSNIVIQTGQTVKIHTGIAMEIPEGYFGAVFARSGLATKQGLRPSNCVGVIDSDYRGEIIVALHNDSNVERRIQDGERIAQLVIMPYLPIELIKVDNLSETGRGTGGFGSTGTTSKI